MGTTTGNNEDWASDYEEADKRPKWMIKMNEAGEGIPEHCDIPCYGCSVYHRVRVRKSWTCPACGTGHGAAYNLGYYAGAYIKPPRKVRKAITVKGLFEKAAGRLKWDG